MRDTTRPGIFGDLGVRLLILVLASLLLFAMQRSGQFQGIRAVLTRVASPVQWRMMVETSRFADSLGEARRNRAAFAAAGALANANEILSAENAVLREALAENERLREQLAYGTANPRFTFQGAHVIGRALGFDPQDSQESLVIDAGRNRGLAVGMPVITPLGLVGRVSAVTDRTARVLLLLDRRSSVSALLQSSRVSGQIEGAAGGGLEMVFITAADPIAPGELAVTSRLGGTLPQGIPIGVVRELVSAGGTSGVRAAIDPAVDFRRLESVMVLTGFELEGGVAHGGSGDNGSDPP